MFGYIIINKGDLKFKEYDIYRAYYCGLCRTLKHKYGLKGQSTLSYDMTFLALLLSALYGKEAFESKNHSRDPLHDFQILFDSTQV